jgi:hypothetical protein
MNLSGRFKKDPEIELESIGNDLLLYSPRNEVIFALNQTSALIWNLCDGNRSVAEIIEILCAAYPDAAVEIPAQVEATLLKLVASQALERIEAEVG